MRCRLVLVVVASLGGLLCACTGTLETNAYRTLAEALGITFTDDGDSGSGGSGGDVEGQFRQLLTLRLRNFHTAAELNTTMMAWVYATNVPSREDADALLASGYTELTETIAIGSVFELPPGTFVYSGPGVGGATPIHLDVAGVEENTIVTSDQFISMTTPDVLLVFSQPPVSCDTPAFYYSRFGEIWTPSFGSGASGGYKTLAQIDVYQCYPLRPGLFLKLTGGGLEPNEFLEGQPITFNFLGFQDADGDHALVYIGDQGDLVITTSQETEP